MLTRIDLQLFKCFSALKLPMSALTLLAGSNAAGKSSIMQALVLLHQTASEHEWSRRLMLNGRSVRLGTISDVIDKVHGRRFFTIGLLDEERPFHWRFGGERGEMSAAIEAVTVGEDIFEEPETLRYLLPPDLAPTLSNRLRRLTYLTAERVGPREVYDLEDVQNAPVVGPTGEHAASVLFLGRDEQVLDELVLDSAPPTRLRQVEARMQQFFPGCALNLQPVSQVNAVTLGIRTSEETDFHRPVNVGFGLTQVLPIVVAALSAQRDDILMIENPEVHLHPAGQAQIGQFLGEVARAGVQVLIETHSDHVLNGIRRSVKAGRLPATDVTLHFLKPRGESQAQVTTPVLDASGNIDDWPEGFFDQFDKDSNYFAGWGD